MAAKSSRVGAALIPSPSYSLCISRRVVRRDTPTAQLCVATRRCSLYKFTSCSPSRSQYSLHTTNARQTTFRTVRNLYSTVTQASKLRRKKGLGPVAKIIHAALGTLIFGLILNSSGLAGFHPRHFDNTYLRNSDLFGGEY